MSPRLYIDTILPHLGAILGLALGFIAIARLMREKRRPSNTFAWLLLIVLAPYIGVPLYLLFGGRKIAKLSRRKESLNLLLQPSLQAALSASPFGIMTRGNRTRFIHTGAEAYQLLIDGIRSAETTIDITTYLLSHDAVGRRVVKELSAKARSGVQVRLLLDAIGSYGKKTLYMLDLEKAGGKIERFMPVFPITIPWTANLRNHRKIAIFDKKSAILGGRNIGREYMGPAEGKSRWRDLGALVEGPAVMALNAIFEEDWRFASHKRGYVPQQLPIVEPFPDADNLIEIMASGPDTTGEPLYEKVLSVIQEAERSIRIVTPYFIPDEVLLRSLIVKARTGKQVTLVVPRKSNHVTTDLARKHFLRQLHEAGVRVLAYTPGMLHGKALLIDDNIAMTGSPNMDLRSLFTNYEVAAFFYSPSDIAAIAEWIAAVEKQSDRLEDADLVPRRGPKGIAEDLCRLIAPLL